MITAVLFPAVAALGLDLLEEGVPRVIVSPQNGPVSGRDSGFGTSLGNRCVAALGVIGTIGRYLRHVPFDWFEEIRKHFAVMPVGGSDFEPDDVFGRFIHGQMNLAPGAAFADTVLANLPFTPTYGLALALMGGEQPSRRIRRNALQPIKKPNPSLPPTPDRFNALQCL